METRLDPLPGLGASAVTWEGRLRLAADLPAVVGIVRDYIATWTPEEIAALPDSCRPWKMLDGEDINFYAFTLVRAHCATARSDAALQRMSGFLAAAVRRLSENRGMTPAHGARPCSPL